VCAINWLLSHVRGVMYTAARFRKIKRQIFCIERVMSAIFFLFYVVVFRSRAHFISHMFRRIRYYYNENSRFDTI